MSAESDLLPLQLLEAFSAALEANDKDEVRLLVDAYARACIAHATAAKADEIEALRAEVNTAKGQAEFYRTERNKNQRKAERLAEALRWYAEQAELCRKLGAAGDSGRRALDADGGKRARAALRDHDHGRPPEFVRCGDGTYRAFKGEGDD